MVVPGRKHEVELVENDDGGWDDLESPGVEAEPESRPTWTWRRVLRAWPIAVVALLVAGVYGIAGARERAAHEQRQAALRGQPGFLEDLSGQFRPLWSTADLDGAFHPVATVAGTVLLWGSRDGAQLVVAVDVVTGEEGWSLDSAVGADRTCWTPVLDTYESGPAVACLSGSVSSDTGAEAFVVEHRVAATGQVLATSGERAASKLAPWGAGLAELVSGNGVTEVRRTDLDGDVAWSSTVLDRELDSGEYVQLFAHDDVVTLVAGRQAVVVDETGRVVVDHSLDEGPGAQVRADGFETDFFGVVDVLPGGRFAVTQVDGRSTWLYSADGTLLLEPSDGEPSAIALDDGSLEGFALVSRPPELVLIDLTSREERVLATDLREAVSLVLDGAVVLSEPTRLSTMDAVTGEERWSVDTAGQIIGSDGAAVIVSERDGLVSRLRAIDLASGRDLWETTVDRTDAWFLPLGGLVYLFDEDGLVRYGR